MVLQKAVYATKIFEFNFRVFVRNVDSKAGNYSIGDVLKSSVTNIRKTNKIP